MNKDYIYLSEIKWKVLQYINNFTQEKKFSPTYKEIAESHNFSRARAGAICGELFKLGLIYDIDIKDDKVEITHTLTSMLCPMADEISKNIKEAGEKVAGVGNVKVIVTHTPPYTRDMLSEEAKLILNL